MSLRPKTHRPSALVVPLFLVSVGLSGCKTEGSNASAESSGTSSQAPSKVAEAKAYAIFDDAINDMGAYGQYLHDAGPLVSKYGGHALAAGPKLTVLEGSVAPANLVILEFPSMTQLNAWYQDPAYQPLLQHRLAATTVAFSIAMGGFAPPPGEAPAPVSSPGKAKAYAIFNDQVTDPQGYGAYLNAAGPIVGRYGGRPLAAGSHTTLLEGKDQPANFVLLEFPDMDSLNHWYEADDYKPLIQKRLNASTVVFSVAMSGILSKR